MQNSPKDFRKKLLGRRGEDLTAQFLGKNGYRILERNYKTPFGEADLIAEKDGTYCFVEVKTRTTEQFGVPTEAVDFRKQERYRRIAAFYCKQQNRELTCRFDVSSILNGTLEYYENAYI